ncbi:MAG TPA: hypothetical protein VI959_02865 [Alphaproteobacteria bacterium]|nr:hypothetical protein [Alphaproteobacteria bacterium]
MNLDKKTAQKKIDILQKKEIAYNRLLAKKAVLLHKMKRQEDSNRKARTRTLIQLGGLFFTTSLPEICDIKEGDDLQDLEFNKGAYVVGFLLHMFEKFETENALHSKDFFMTKGINHLKKRAYVKELS